MNFYQSNLRRTINSEIYKKPTFETNISGKKYFGIVKSQRRFGKNLQWYMIHGIQGVNHEKKDEEFEESLQRIQRDFGATRGDIFFQCGFLDEFETHNTTDLKKDEKITIDYMKKKERLKKKKRNQCEMVPSRREHMPDTTIQIPLVDGIQHARKGYSSSGKRYINKAKKAELVFDVAQKKEWEKFREIRYTMAYDKGFVIPSKEVFLQLMNYLESQKKGWLFLSKKGNKIVSGSVVLEYSEHKKNELIYLYGATNREYGNIGGHYRLTDQILKWGSDKKYDLYDLLGVAPPGNDSHYLSGVTRFKQAFGGKTIISVGNYDRVFNSLLYRTMQLRSLGKMKYSL